MSAARRPNHWIADNVLRQPRESQLSDVLGQFPSHRERSRAEPPRLLHLINLYPTPGRDDPTQRLTVESIRRALAADRGPTEVMNLQLAVDPDQTPPDFTRGPDLTRTIKDLRPDLPAKPFPVLFDILRAGGRCADPDDYIVYSNADICLQPAFYNCLREFIARGFDGVVVNRRTVGAVEAFAGMSALVAAETGKPHEGYDCFVFRAGLLDRFLPCEACIGASFVARALLYNLVVHADALLILENASLTYHYGDDKPWRAGEFEPLRAHNRQEVLGLVDALRRDPRSAERLSAFAVANNEPHPVRLRLGVPEPATRRGRRRAATLLRRVVRRLGG